MPKFFRPVLFFFLCFFGFLFSSGFSEWLRREAESSSVRSRRSEMSRTSESSGASELDLQVIVPVGRVQFTFMDESNALPDHITLHGHRDDAGYHHPVPAEAIDYVQKDLRLMLHRHRCRDNFGQDFRFRPASGDTSAVQVINVVIASH